jgi:seryl-tRNA synthetase
LGNKITGAGFPFTKEGAKLQRELITYFRTKKYRSRLPRIPQVPHLVNEVWIRTGQLGTKKVRCTTSTVDDLYLIPTAEVPVTNLFRDVIVAENE